MAPLIGSPERRLEDLRLLTGRGRYTDDVSLPGMVYAGIVRSPWAHARITSVDAGAARALPGVVAVFTGSELKDRLGTIPTAWLPPDSGMKTPAHPPLAWERVRYVGDGVALVVAESRSLVEDAMELVKVGYEPLPAVVDQEDARKEGAPLLHDDVPGNLAFHWKAGEVPEEVMASAEVVVRQRFRQQPLIPNPMEPRCAVARWDASTGDMTVWVTSQNPHIHRLLLSGILGIPEHRLRVVAIDVGGGFGSKIPCYADEALVAFAARELGVPVKWTETRQENFAVTTHGRDMLIDVSVAGKRDGTLMAIQVKNVANMGAYLSTAAPGVPTILFGLITTGSYTFKHAAVDVEGVFTNTTPTDAYRGAGRPEATYLVERMVDLFAREIGMDPVEVRRHNLIPQDAFPYPSALGLTYDSGNYQVALEKALEKASYADLRREQDRLRSEGRYLGIGVTTYVEISGLGPSEVAGAVGFQGGLWELADVRVHPSGKVTAFTGGSPHGQGEETAFAQVVADRFAIPINDVEVVHGDTDRVAMGWGTYGSRTMAVGGGALALAADRVIEKATKIAAHLFETDVQDVVFEDGAFYVKGARTKRRSFQEVALQAHLAWNLPEGVEPSLEAQASYDPANFTFPFGAHVAVVEVDAETGEITLRRYVAVDDCGRVVNPLLAEGQVHGGIVQGIGQALWEGAVYDRQGQLLTGSLLDYALPKARSLPPFETSFTETPSPHNPLGVKGIGETGTIAATPTVVNAVMDALAPFGVRDIDMPLWPERVLAAIDEGRKRG